MSFNSPADSGTEAKWSITPPFGSDYDHLLKELREKYPSSDGAAKFYNCGRRDYYGRDKKDKILTRMYYEVKLKINDERKAQKIADEMTRYSNIAFGVMREREWEDFPFGRMNN